MNWQLEISSPIPLHLQFEQRLRERIDSGEWQPGDKIPAERELMELAHISRATVRQAIASLVNQNLLEKVHGAGTFVKHRKFEQPLQVVYSFSEQLRQAGLELVDQLLERSLVPCTPKLAKQMQLEPGTPLVHIHRLRLLNGVPLMINRSYIPYYMCPGLLTEPLSGSLYRTLAEHYQLPILRATDRLEAHHPDRALSSLLQIGAHVPVMYVERVAMTTGDVVLHAGANFIRGDRCYFRIDLQAQPTTLSIKPAL